MITMSNCYTALPIRSR